MIVRLWGVRGSSPTPLSPEEIRNKIAAVVQRIKPSDLENSETRQRFLTHLPQDIFGTLGGNTACIEVRSSDGKIIILDTGTGLRNLEKRLLRFRDNIKDYHIFISHFHYDHLLGLPYFNAMYNPNAHVHFYSPYPAMERNLAKLMDKPFHPVGWDSFAAEIDFHILAKSEKISIGTATVDWIKRNHPDGSISYKVSEAAKSFIYSTDTELTEKDFEHSERHIDYFQGADAIVLDSQYTLGEAIEKYNWGHSSYSLVVEFVREFKIKKLLLFHHDPLNSDRKMEDLLKSARLFDKQLEHHSKSKLEIDLAREGQQLDF